MNQVNNTITLEKVNTMSTTCTLTLEVKQMRVESESVMSLELADPNGNQLPAWEPGAHIDIDLGPGLIRNYSLCGDPADLSSYRIGVLREPASRGGSQHIHEVLRPGHLVQISEPRNNFKASESDKSLIFIAGGIGITPILAMANQALEQGRDFQLFYGGKSRKSMAFLKEIEVFGDRANLTSDDEEGRLDLDGILRNAPSGDYEVFVCGPGGLIDEIERRSEAWPKGTFHCERFVAKKIEAPVNGEREFTVSCTQSNLMVSVAPDESILATLEKAGMDVPFSCREGTCGTCETDIISGTPDHRDSLLSSEEQESGETMLICVSRCKSDLLELDI